MLIGGKDNPENCPWELKNGGFIMLMKSLEEAGFSPRTSPSSLTVETEVYFQLVIMPLTQFAAKHFGDYLKIIAPVTGDFDLTVVPFSSNREMLWGLMQAKDHYYEICYTTAGSCIVLAANGCVRCDNSLRWLDTDVYILPVCSTSKKTVQCFSGVKLERYFDIESGCRCVDLEINLKFDGTEETVRVPLCLYADVYRPSALPLRSAGCYISILQPRRKI